MATLAEEELLKELIAKSSAVLANRYMTAAGITILIYDSVQTFGAEVRLIWMQPWNVVRVMFIFTRYVTLGNLFLTAYVTSGLGDHSTVGWITTAGVSCLVCILLNNYILIKHIYSLYDHRKNILRILQYTCGLTYVVAFIFVALTLRELVASIQWDPYVYHTCIFTTPARFFVGIWSPQVAFELFTFALTVINAAERPRPADIKLITNLNRDGLVYIVVLFLIRTTNMVLSAIPNPSLNLMVTFFAWAVTILTLSHLVLRVEEMRLKAARLAGYVNAVELSLRDGTTQSLPRVVIETVVSTV